MTHTTPRSGQPIAANAPASPLSARQRTSQRGSQGETRLFACRNPAASPTGPLDADCHVHGLLSVLVHGMRLTKSVNEPTIKPCCASCGPNQVRQRDWLAVIAYIKGEVRGSASWG
jgi:hypothetical protein